MKKLMVVALLSLVGVVDDMYAACAADCLDYSGGVMGGYKWTEVDKEFAKYAASGCSGTVASLVESHPEINVNYPNPDTGDTPLHYAVMKGFSGVFGVLMARKDAGLDLNARNKQGKTPLDCCVVQLSSFTDILREAGAKQGSELPDLIVLEKEATKSSELMSFMPGDVGSDNVDSVNCLNTGVQDCTKLDQCALGKKLTAEIQRIVRSGTAEELERYLDEQKRSNPDIDLPAVVEAEDYQELTIFEWAIDDQEWDMVIALAKRGFVAGDIRFYRLEGLVYGLPRGHFVEIFQTLLKRHEDLLVRRNEYNLSIVEYLLEKGINNIGEMFSLLRDALQNDDQWHEIFCEKKDAYGDSLRDKVLKDIEKNGSYSGFYYIAKNNWDLFDCKDKFDVMVKKIDSDRTYEGCLCRSDDEG